MLPPPPTLAEATRRAAPGIEAVAWLRAAAAAASQPQRVLLSHATAALRTRGWLPALPSLLDQAAAHGHCGLPALTQAAQELCAWGLLTVEGDRVVEIAGLWQTRATGLTFLADGGEPVHLTGPVAALVASQAFGAVGRVEGKCALSATPVTLRCDTTGVHERAPETLAMFLPRWSGAEPVAAAIRGGALFRDDDAMERWCAARGEPDGLTLASYLLPMAMADLSEQLGAALEPLFDALAHFD